MRHWEDLERLLNALYLKEIDQEENVWRSLPFFSATLAVEVVVLNQILPAAAGTSGIWWWALMGSGVALAALIFGVLLFLYRSIRRRSFSYIARGRDLVEYARALEAADPAAGPSPGAGSNLSAPSVADRLRATLIGQLAAAMDANRGINQSRAAERTRAGILLLASIVATSVIVGVTIGHDIAVDAEREPGHAAPEPKTSPADAGSVLRPGLDHPAEGPGPSGAAKDAGSEQGLELPRTPRDAGAGGGAER